MTLLFQSAPRGCGSLFVTYVLKRTKNAFVPGLNFYGSASEIEGKLKWVFAPSALDAAIIADCLGHTQVRRDAHSPRVRQQVAAGRLPPPLAASSLHLRFVKKKPGVLPGLTIGLGSRGISP